jgi:hypothetical protein
VTDLPPSIFRPYHCSHCVKPVRYEDGDTRTAGHAHCNLIAVYDSIRLSQSPPGRKQGNVITRGTEAVRDARGAPPDSFC